MDELEQIKREIGLCSRCNLSRTRKFPVPGEGNPDAKVMLIGLGPGYQENQQGKPFVGPAGKFLNELLELAGLMREDVYITNVVKCYLPDNQPTPAQIDACSPYLDRQIEILKPETIIPLGNVATTYILRRFKIMPETIGRVHGKSIRHSNLQMQPEIIPMYHPASALYNPGMREILRADWENLKGIQSY